MEAIVEILDVTWFEEDRPALLGSNIDAPAIGARSSTYGLEIGGWVLGHKSKATEIEIVYENRAIRKVPVREVRTDVAERFPGSAEALNCGFWTTIGVLGMARDFELLLQAVLADGSRVLLVTIRGRHKRIGRSRTSPIQPLMVTTWGRSGSTLLMTLLLEHPDIIGYRQYPYEIRVAGYWMHLLKVLSEPSDHSFSAHPDNFTEDLHWIGHMPFYAEPLTTNPLLKHWFGRKYVEQSAEFCRKSIQRFYTELAEAQGQKKPKFFAEKNHPTHTSWLLWELYPNGREIFLVRDFRDVVCSILAFNAKRGRACFGSEQSSTTEAFIELQRTGAECLLAAWKRRSDISCLVRYEDLVLKPADTLRTIFTYLGLEWDPEFFSNAMAAASVESLELQNHRTSKDPKASIGRWRTELTPEVQALCQTALCPILNEFGYSSEIS